MTNSAPTVSITAPTSGTVFTAPANITVSANAADSDGTVTQVQFFANGAPIGTDTTAPYSIDWTNVAAGTYALTAKAIDNNNAETISAPISINVRTVSTLYFIHADHLSTPREIYNDQQQLVWRRSNTEPFGDSVAEENPSGLGVFEFLLGFAGQYYDKETGNWQNWMRDYSALTGRYLESDPIGLGAGVNTFAYVWQSPLMFVDPMGLLFECWWSDLGNAEKCDLTGLRRQKPTRSYRTKEGFPAPDPQSPSISVNPMVMPQPGMKLIWRTVFREKGYWEAELDCKVWSLYVCRDDCGKLIKLPGNRPLGRRWIKQEDYDEIVGYGSWTDVTTPSGPSNLDVRGPRPRIR